MKTGKIKPFVVSPLVVILLLTLLAVQLSAQTETAEPSRVLCFNRIDGFKFLDVNGNGVWDQPAEPPLQGWEIRLSNGSVAYTDDDGYYAFETRDFGVFTVSEVCPAGWAQSMPGFTDFDTCGTQVHTATIDYCNQQVHNLNFGNGQPKLDLAKACPADVFLGDEIPYTITVTNTGNVALQGLALDDPFLGLSETLDLGPGESETFSASYNTSEQEPAADRIINTATVTGDYAQATVTAADRCVTTIHKLQVRKDAQTSLTRTYHWTIDKTAGRAIRDRYFVFLPLIVRAFESPAGSWPGGDGPPPARFSPGHSFTVQYTVTVDLADPPYVEGGWAVSGTITVDNPAPMDAALASVSDMVSPDIAATVTCPALIVPAGGSLTCTYGPVQLPDASARINTATATLINNNGQTTDFRGTASVDFGQASIELIDEEIQISDTFSDLLPNTLGTVRYDQVPVAFTYMRKIQTPGNACQLVEVPNEAAFVTNDTGTTGSAAVIVRVFEPCTLTTAYEDLPSALGNDWDYNDWVAVLNIEAEFSSASPSGGLLRLAFAINPEARGAAFNHEYHLRFPAGTFGCHGTSTQTLFDGAGNTLSQKVRPFDASADNDFAVIPWTGDALPALSNTDESKPYTPTARTASLSIAFAESCPFDPDNLDPTKSATVHGEGLFFNPYLHVVRTDEDIGAGDSRTLIVPVDWQWPEERIGIWLAYPDVAEGNPPIFPLLWWLNSTDQVYNRP